MYLRVILFIFLMISPLFASITDDLLKLSEMYKQGLLTKDEFNKAKSILLEIDSIESSTTDNTKKKETTVKKKITKKKSKTSDKKKFSNNIKIERIFTTDSSKFTNKSFEKMKLTVGDFMIYTHRPGAIKIKGLSDNKQYAVIGDKLQFKYYNKGQNFLDIKVDKPNKELILKINDTKTLVWKGQYVQKAEATFYQILAMGRLPFHFYIKLDTADNAHALNMEKFNRRIELAVNEVKKDLATQYNLTISQIDQIIEQNDMLAAYGESVPTNTQFNETEQKKIQLYESLKASIGNENFEQLKTNSNTILQDELNKAIDNEVQFAIDETIRDAINSGIEAAALEAGLAALINALMQGASWADALKAGEQACTGHGGC